MEGDAGTSQLNPTDADQAPDESLADADTPDPQTEEATAEPADGRRPSRLGRGWVATIAAGLLVLAAAGGVGTRRARTLLRCRRPGSVWRRRTRPMSRR
jgi:Mce-associated membrane protein